MNRSPVHLRKITLHLARCKEFPDGSTNRGYEFVAPLDSQDRIDADQWKTHRAVCGVRRFWGDAPLKRGLLVHKPGGSGGANWGFDYDPATSADDEAGFHFGDHAFRKGEYVSILDQEGEMHTFRVDAVV